jgi:hypothetical protein
MRFGAGRKMMKIVFAAVLAGVALAPSLDSRADGKGSSGWIGTWTASAQRAWLADFPISLWFPSNFYKHTIRQIARVSIGGSKVRIVVSNEYGKQPLKLGAAHIAVTADEAAIKPGTDRALTFSGSPTITIPPGAPVISDPVDLKVVPLSELSVSLFFPEGAPATTMHWDGHQTAYVAAGDRTAETDFKVDLKLTQRIFLTGILVDAAEDARAIVLFGDSITDGDGSTLDGNDR